MSNLIHLSVWLQHLLTRMALWLLLSFASSKMTDINQPDEHQRLSIAFLDLVSLPQKFDEASELRSLDASHNRLTDLQLLENCTQLETLILDNNLLPSACKLPSLPNLRCKPCKRKLNTECKRALGASTWTAQPDLRFFYSSFSTVRQLYIPCKGAPVGLAGPDPGPQKRPP